MAWLRRLVGWTGRRDRALADELEAHRAFVEDELRRSGLSAADAASEARRRLGNVTLASEDSREAWTFRWLDQLKQHTRFGLRGLRREPLFALTAILMLALGTAATTTVFSVADAEIWRPLPYADPYRLVEVYSHGPDSRTDADGISLEELAAWRRAPGLSSLAAIGSSSRQTLQLARAESIVVRPVTANFFSTLRITALRGRAFNDEDARGAQVALLTERSWNRVFDRDPAILGRVLTVDGSAKTIVGIMKDDDVLFGQPDLFVPLDERLPAARTTLVFGGLGRLADGASAGPLGEHVQSVVTTRSVVDDTRRGHIAVVEDLNAYYTPLDRGKLFFFLGASVLVLLLTMTNTAALLLARVLRRAPEFALRGALGGGAKTIAMQLVVEASLIVVPASLFGLWAAAQAISVIGHIVPDDFLLRGTQIPLDGRVVICCGVIAAVTMAGLALAPIGLARRVGIAAIGAGGRTSALPSASRSRAILLTSQVALTVILLAGASMFLRSFVALLHVPLGFEATAGWSATVSLSGPRYAEDAERRAYAQNLVDRARAIPGVRAAAVATSSPLMSGWLVLAFDARRAASPGDAGLRTIYRAVGGDYFRAIGTPIVGGRPLSAADNAGAPRVAVVNQEFVRRLFRGEDPVGRTINLVPVHAPQAESGLVTIVGVAQDIKEIGPDEIAFADIYVSFDQGPARSLELIVRTAAEEGAPASTIRAAAAAVDPTMPVTSISSLTNRVASATHGARFNLILVAGFAVAAVLIAAIGIYGAMAYAATARGREYGVRLALGATPRELIGRALWQAARIGLVGGLLGIGGALLLARWIGDSVYLVAGKHNGMLFGVTTSDPISLAAGLGGVVALAVMAGAMPARRVSKIDPVQALRAE